MQYLFTIGLISTLFVLIVSGCSDSTIIEADTDEEADYAHLVQEVVKSNEFQILLDLRQKGLEMVFDALDRGITKEELATAFKIESGLIEDSQTHLLMNSLGLKGDYDGIVESTVDAINKKFPDLINLRSEFQFAENCIPTEDKIDKYFENIERFRVLKSTTLNKSADVNEDECNACGGSCRATYLVLGCSVVGCLVTGGFFGCAFAIWGCGCAVCPEDLPTWLGKEECGGTQ